MKTFVITDTHFFHGDLYSKFHERPKDFQEKIVKSWYRDVTDDDLVLHLGDVLIGSTTDWKTIVPGLPGRKILIKGNHDNKSNDWYMSNGFDFCCDSFDLKKFGLNIHFSHIPATQGNFDLNIHGHLHAGRHHTEVTVDERHYLLSLEHLGYHPHLLKTLVQNWNRSIRCVIA